MAGLKARSGPPGNKNRLQHGLYSLRALLSGDGLDQRTSLYKALREKERELTVSLGGDPSPQEKAIIADTVKTMLFLGSLDHYLTGLKSLVRKGRVHCVLSERTRLAAHMRENLKTLGLTRQTKVPTLADLLAEDDDPDDEEARRDGLVPTNGDGAIAESQEK
jgi:hypothetical protein